MYYIRSQYSFSTIVHAMIDIKEFLAIKGQWYLSTSTTPEAHNLQLTLKLSNFLPRKTNSQSKHQFFPLIFDNFTM